MYKKLSVVPIILILLGSCFCTAGAAVAEPFESIDFDIFRSGDSLNVWLDMEPLVTSERVEQMKQGIDLAIQYDLTLMRPRRLWGAQKLNSFSGFLHIGYRVVAEDFFLSRTVAATDSALFFVSVEPLAEFLTDSIQAALCDVDSLDSSARYYLELKITAITLTAFNLASEDDTPEGQESSPIKYLFKKFLQFTDFGREEFQFKSRLFSLSEIAAR